MNEYTTKEWKDILFKKVEESALAKFKTAYNGYLPLCGSPIEKTLLGAIIYIFVIEDTFFSFVRSPDREFKLSKPNYSWKEVITFYAQAKVGKYRADFLFDIIDQNNKRRILVVECDGHDFHEKTKIQVARDKKRDRWMTNQGIDILRFSGSEIWKDAFSCALEIENMVCRLSMPNQCTTIGNIK